MDDKGRGLSVSTQDYLANVAGGVAASVVIEGRSVTAVIIPDAISSVTGRYLYEYVLKNPQTFPSFDKDAATNDASAFVMQFGVQSLTNFVLANLASRMMGGGSLGTARGAFTVAFGSVLGEWMFKQTQAKKSVGSDSGI